MSHLPQYILEGWRPHGPYWCKCPRCGGVSSTNALARARHKCPAKDKEASDDDQQPTR